VARCGCGDRIPARLLITIIALARAGHGWPHRLYHRRAVHAHPTVRARLPGGPGRPAWRFPCLIIGQLRWAGLQGPVHPRLIDGWNWLISQQAHRSTVVGVMDGPARLPCVAFSVPDRSARSGALAGPGGFAGSSRPQSLLRVGSRLIDGCNNNWLITQRALYKVYGNLLLGAREKNIFR
jgi:hypothetical protein